MIHQSLEGGWALHNLKGILRYSYCPHTITKAVLDISSFQTLTCQYPATISIIMYTTAPPSLSKIILELGNSPASLMVALLSSVVSLQSLIFHLPSDLKTSIIVISNI